MCVKKRGIYIVDHELSPESDGVDKKIMGQVKAFKRAGLDIDLLEYHMEMEATLVVKILRRLPFSNVQPHWEYDERLTHCDFIYIRKPFLSGPVISLLKKIRIKNPKVRIVMEFPTYPYDSEMKDIKKNYPLFIKDFFARKELYGLVNRIAHLGEEKEIFKVSTIKFYNGYDFYNTRVRKIRKMDGVIRLCCVACFHYWHGCERLIKGVRDYYDRGGDRKIIVTLVGPGDEVNYYKNLVNKLCLEEYFIFTGRMNKKEIDEIYDLNDLGFGSLGLYKKDMSYSCELKTREYLSVGLPFFIGCKLDAMAIKELDPYILEFPNDSSAIDIQKIVDFYDALYKKNDFELRKMPQIIHDLAEEHLNMDEAMKNVVQYFKTT